MDRDKIINELERINRELFDVWQEIVAKNNNDNQFDYVTSPKMADQVMLLSIRIEKIDKLVFQK